MRFAPKTEEQIAADGLIPANTIVDFEVLEAEEATSKAGNPMIALKLRVWRPDGSTTTLRDWLVSNFPAKLLGFAKSTGMRAAYDAGAMHAEDMEGKTGKLKIAVEPEKDGYPAKNKAAFYVEDDEPRRGAQPAQQRAPATSKSDLDDEIPF